MLRRAISSRFPAPSAAACRLIASGQSGRMSPETAKKARDEDKSDLERERELRERFYQKIQQTMPNFYNPNKGSSSDNRQQHQQSSSQNQQQQGPFSGFGPTQLKFVRLTFFGVSLYLLITLSRLRTPDSPMMLMQGMPWWEVPADILVAHTLIRHVVSFREQRNLKNEFELQCKQFPTLTFTQFLSRSFPNLLSGYRTSQNEILAALTACFAVSRDMKIADTIQKGVRTNLRDTKAAIDAIMEGLKTDFPQVFSTVATPVVQSPMVSPQQPMMMAPQVSYVYGGGYQQQQHIAPTHVPPHASAHQSPYGVPFETAAAIHSQAQTAAVTPNVAVVQQEQNGDGVLVADFSQNSKGSL